MPRQNHVPAYRLHKQSGQAVVTLTDPTGRRKDFLLGPHGTPHSRTEYARLIAEWETGGRRLPGTTYQTDTLTVNELLLHYCLFAERYYQKDGRPTSQYDRVKRSLRFVRELYGFTPAADFGPLALKTVREKMIEAGWNRVHVNHCVGCIKRCFKWAVENELVPPSVHQALACVAGLRKGRSEAREGGRVLPVADEYVDATLPFLTPPVRAMVRLQRVTGMRPGEVVIMRLCDIDRTKADAWVYRPGSHKTEHHELSRAVVLGPKAQEVLTPFLSRDPEAYCFSPKEAVADLRDRQRRARKTRVQPSQVCRKKPRPKKRPGDAYRPDTYYHAILRGICRANTDRACEHCKRRKPNGRCAICQAAAIPRWHPHQLRHSYATEVRKLFGLEGAQVALGHANAQVTEIYAERDLALAEKIAREVG